MCCGTAQNSYRTVAGMRVMLADGTLLDTEDPLSVDAFSRSHAVLLGELERLGRDTRNNGQLAERIRHKFKIKNTTGYSLNALVDYEDPIDILTHLMIGSEGTLGFISRITYETVVEDPFKASALVFFPDIRSACEAVIRLKPQPVSAVELLDRPALHSVENKPGLPAIMRELGEEAAALLVEVRAATVDGLKEKISAVHAALAGVLTVEPAIFSTDPATCDMYWKVRKGTFPSIENTERTLAPEAERFYRNGAPLLQRYLPFWLANLIDRMWVVMVSIIAILIPLSRVVPPLYQFRVRSRIFRWYGQLRRLEDSVAERPLPELLSELDGLEDRAGRIHVPLSYADELYALRSNIHMVRRRLQGHEPRT